MVSLTGYSLEGEYCSGHTDDPVPIISLSFILFV